MEIIKRSVRYSGTVITCPHCGSLLRYFNDDIMTNRTFIDENYVYQIVACKCISCAVCGEYIDLEEETKDD